MKISAQVFTHESLKLLYTTYENPSPMRSEITYLSDRKIWAINLLHKNVEDCMLHIWKSGWQFCSMNCEFSTFYLWKYWCWPKPKYIEFFCILYYQNQESGFLTCYVEFPIFPMWKSGCWFPYLKLRILYISYMTIWHLFP